MKTCRFVSNSMPAVALIALSLAPSPARAQKSVEGEKLTALHRVARLVTLRSRSKTYNATAVFPQFRARTALARFANAQIRQSETKAFRDWVAETRRETRTAPPNFPYEYSSAPAPEFFVAPRLLSTRLDLYEFEDGAHGMTIARPLNFGLVNGRAKRLVLGDFFRVGSDYRALVQTQIFAKLKKDPNAAWVQDKSVSTLATEQFNSFTASRDGLRWIFNQYEMGPYAAGIFEVKLTAAELGPNFRREMLG